MKFVKLTLFYDNWCPKCTRFSEIIKKLDWLKLLDFKQLRNEEDVTQFSGIDIELAKKQMASYTNQWHYGFKSIYLILVRTPLFFPFIPLLFFLNISRIGQFLYIQLAVNRTIIPLHCTIEGCSTEK
jgi:predicted DCC family thiol-disulfide oxidoreductase YuxK